MLNLKPEGHFHFSAKGADGMPYELDLELFDSINIEVGWTVDWFYLLGALLYYYDGIGFCCMQEIKKTVGPQDVRYLLKKANSKLWPRLLKMEGKPPFLKIDSVSIWRNHYVMIHEIFIVIHYLKKLKYFHDLLYLQKLDVRAAAFDTQNDENQLVNKANEVQSDNEANEGVPFSPFHLWCPERWIECDGRQGFTSWVLGEEARCWAHASRWPYIRTIYHAELEILVYMWVI